ncbi:MFS transporter [Rubripirellula amarantea]|uniref:Major Facilitator Superfamily protein n=1 Tax=Rubripirellula amarantea TaxID=2527999 RepID=A0A5C5WXI4_9BACT|nr:MFS transporter [Rubripirellula amarantea]MDA8743798.1 MFS transporter [Rubripirellula amarantea]TWT54713.1 Major Facilitator Superfamily protein [Rubripirellula amarantea]
MLHRASDTLAAKLPFFYGYLMIPLAMMLQITTSPGQTFAFSAFTPSFRQAFAMSDSHLTFAYMLGTFLAAIPLTIVGPLSDRFGLKGLSTLAVLGVSLTCWLASFATGWWNLLLVFFLLRLLGQGSLSLLGGNAISMWFRNRIGRVSALMSIGTAFAFAWVPGMIRNSIDAIGWRDTYQVIAVLVAATTLPLVLIFFRNRPEEIGQSVDGGHTHRTPTQNDKTPLAGSQQPTRTEPDAIAIAIETEPSMTFAQAIRTPAFWILAVTNLAWALIGTGVVFYLYIICQQRGFEVDVPSNLFKTFGLCMLAGQLGGGVLADFVRLNRMLGLGTAMLCLGISSLLVGRSETTLQAFAVFFGGGQGLLLAVGSVVWVRYYGRQSLGSIRGSAWCATVAGSGCGPLLMGMSLDRYGSFDPAIKLFLVTMGILAVASWFAINPSKVLNPEPSLIVPDKDLIVPGKEIDG